MAFLDSTAMRAVRKVLLSLLAAYCICVSVVAPVLFGLGSGSPGDSGAAALEHRLRAIEELKIEHRLTRVQTQVDAMQLQLHGAVGGVGALLIEAVFRIGKRKTKGGE